MPSQTLTNLQYMYIPFIVPVLLHHACQRPWRPQSFVVHAVTTAIA